MLLSRQTFIALRARRTAHRVASEILHPPSKREAPLPVLPVVLTPDDEVHARPLTWLGCRIWLWTVFFIVIVCGYVVAILMLKY